MEQQCLRSILSSIAKCALASVLIMVLLATKANCQASREHYKVGVYITSIYAIDMASRTYAADLWIWSVGTSPTRDPLATMEFVASDKITRRMESTIRRGDLYWRQARIVGTFRQSWDLRQFPFDKQVLVLTVEEGINDVTRVTYDVDTDDTGYQPDASPQGWRIMSQQVTTETTHYATGFGDPAGGKGSDYAKLQVVITLQRASVATFLNLAAPLYAGFLLCTISFLLHKDGRAIVESRLTLLGSALFAVVLHMQAVSSVLGSEHQLTIVDCLNIAVLIYIVFGAIVAVTAGIRHNKGRPISVRLEYFCGAAIAVSFAVINIFLLAHAI